MKNLFTKLSLGLGFCTFLSLGFSPAFAESKEKCETCAKAGDHSCTKEGCKECEKKDGHECSEVCKKDGHACEHRHEHGSKKEKKKT